MTSSKRSIEFFISRYTNADSAPGDAFIRAYQRLVRVHRETLFDVTVAAMSAHIQVGQELKEIDPLLVQAIRDTAPSVLTDNLSTLTQNQLNGAVSTAKGKYFEYLVEDRLNRGEQVGPLLLEQGQKAMVAESLTQPGWDLRIIDSEGFPVEYLQLKASDSVAYIKSALERYPDIQILATSEVSESGLVLDSGLTEYDLHSKVEHAIDVLDVSLASAFFEYFSPLIPLAAVLAFEGHRLLIGQASIDEFKLSLARRGQRVMATQAAGAVAFALGAGWLTVPAAITGGLLFERYLNQTSLTQTYESRRSRLLALRLVQQHRYLSR